MVVTGQKDALQVVLSCFTGQFNKHSTFFSLVQILSRNHDCSPIGNTRRIAIESCNSQISTHVLESARGHSALKFVYQIVVEIPQVLIGIPHSPQEISVIQSLCRWIPHCYAKMQTTMGVAWLSGGLDDPTLILHDEAHMTDVPSLLRTEDQLEQITKKLVSYPIQSFHGPRQEVSNLICALHAHF